MHPKRQLFFFLADRWQRGASSVASVKKKELCSSLGHDDAGLNDPQVCVVTVELCAIVNKRFGTHEHKKYMYSHHAPSLPLVTSDIPCWLVSLSCLVLSGSASGCRYISSSVLWGAISRPCHAPRIGKKFFFSWPAAFPLLNVVVACLQACAYVFHYGLIFPPFFVSI